MNLEQFRAELEGNAQKKVEELEPENKYLRANNNNLLALLKERDKEIARLENEIKTLKNKNPNLIDWGNHGSQDGIKIDMSHKEALVTIAMLGQMVGDANR